MPKPWRWTKGRIAYRVGLRALGYAACVDLIKDSVATNYGPDERAAQAAHLASSLRDLDEVRERLVASGEAIQE